MSNNIYRQTIFPILTLFHKCGNIAMLRSTSITGNFGCGCSISRFHLGSSMDYSYLKIQSCSFCYCGNSFGLSSYFLWINRNAPCPVEEKQAKACMFLRKFSLYTIIISIIIYIVGFFFAFLAADLFFG